MKKFLIAAFFVSIVGCATTQVTQLETLVSHSKSSQFPVISVSFDRQAGCIQYGCSSKDDNGQKLIKALIDSDQFSRVDVDNAFNEYKLILSYKVENNNFLSIPNSLLTFYSFGIVPTVEAESHVVNFNVFKKEQLLKLYSYNRDESGYRAIWHKGIDKDEVFKSIVSEFIADVSKDKIMPTLEDGK